MVPSATLKSTDATPIASQKAPNGKTQLQNAEKIDLVLRTFRCLIADLCQQFNGGHPGYVALAPNYAFFGAFANWSVLKRCHGNGSHRCGPLEICHEIFANKPFLLQPRSICLVKRTHMPVSILFPPSHRLQGHDNGTVEIISFHENRLSLSRSS